MWMKKRFRVCVAVLALLCCVLAGSAAAQELPEALPTEAASPASFASGAAEAVSSPDYAPQPAMRTASAKGSLYQEGGLPSAAQTSAVPSDFETYLVAELNKVSAKINIEKYGLQRSAVFDMFMTVINKHPELFHVQSAIQIDYYMGSGLAVAIYPSYLYTAAQLPGLKAQVNAEANRILAYASTATTALGKALLVNDYFCIHYEYDNDLAIFDLAQLFIQKKGVCQAYMLGYKYIMKLLGIPEKTVTSEAMNHTWNAIQIGGKWYHVDVTWDDPTLNPITPYRAGHEYFLVSDARIKQLEHHDWDITTGATAANYDSMFWKDVDSPICVQGGVMTYAVDGAVYQWQSGSPQKLCSASTNNKSWAGVLGDTLYYTTSRGVFASEPDGSSRKTLYAPTTSGNIGFAYVDGSTLHLYFEPYSGSGYDVSVALAYAPLKTLRLPSGTVSIGANAFEGGAFGRVICGDALETIGAGAFKSCAGLREVVLGDGITSIAEDAFAGCAELTLIAPFATAFDVESYAAEHGFGFELAE